jgi:hypothetical protein
LAEVVEVVDAVYTVERRTVTAVVVYRSRDVSANSVSRFSVVIITHTYNTVRIDSRFSVINFIILVDTLRFDRVIAII